MRSAVSAILVFAASSAAAANVEVPLNDITINLSALMQAGYSYYFQDDAQTREHVGSGYFSGQIYRIGVNGYLSDRFFYRAEYGTDLDTRNYVGFRVSDRFTVKAGQDVIPYTVEGQLLPEQYITTSLTHLTDIFERRGFGLRGDFEIGNGNPRGGVSTGFYPFTSPTEGHLDTVTGRAFLAAALGKTELEFGVSGFERKEIRDEAVGEYPQIRFGTRYLPAPRVAGDAAFRINGFAFLAEYSQYFVDGVLITTGESRRGYYYKNLSETDYYGLAAYSFALPWRYFHAFQPYSRYERYEPAVYGKRYIAKDYYTGGFDLYFLNNNLMFRADYTRVLEDVLPMKNDVIASYFQLYF